MIWILRCLLVLQIMGGRCLCILRRVVVITMRICDLHVCKLIRYKIRLTCVCLRICGWLHMRSKWAIITLCSLALDKCLDQSYFWCIEVALRLLLPSWVVHYLVFKISPVVNFYLCFVWQARFLNCVRTSSIWPVRLLLLILITLLAFRSLICWLLLLVHLHLIQTVLWLILKWSWMLKRMVIGLIHWL